MFLSVIEDKIAAYYVDECDQITDFLTLEEASEAQKLLSQSGLSFYLWGGYENAERRILCLGETRNLADCSIVVLCGNWDRFGEISHRDILGGIMSSGIQRKCIGDILVDSAKRCFYLFAVKRMADYLIDSVDRIGKCSIEWSFVEDLSAIPTELAEEKKISVSSLRIDAMIAAIWNLSRQQAQDMIDAKLVYVDHVLDTKATQILRVGCSIVCRGKGKAVFLDECGLSKKGRTYILIKQFK